MSVPSTSMAPVATPQAPATGAAETPWQRLRRQYFASRVATVALALLVLLVACAFAAPLIAPQDPYDLSVVSVIDANLAPGSTSASGLYLWLGSDGAGRDLLSAILYGLRISVSVGIASAAIALVLGTSIGLLAAHAGGRVDALLMRVVDLQLSIPAILVALMLLAAFGQGVDKTLIALIVVQWAYYARTVRGAALVERQKEYVEAAISQGLPARRIMFGNILPNCVAPLLVTVTLQTAGAITLEATMSFLGIGLPQTEPSLGLLVSNGFEAMLSNEYWVAMFPGLALALLVACINLVGDQLRKVLNPKLDS